MLNKKRVCRNGYAGNLRGYLISRFNKYPRNPRNFLSSKLIRPTVAMASRSFCTLQARKIKVKCICTVVRDLMLLLPRLHTCSHVGLQYILDKKLCSFHRSLTPAFRLSVEWFPSYYGSVSAAPESCIAS